MKLAVIVLNYNGINETLECIKSLALTQSSQKLEIIVVDNASDDGSQKILSNIQNIKLVENKENLGFSGGMNAGIRFALKNNYEAIIILNNDVIVDKDFAHYLVETAKKADIVSPKIYFAPGFEFHKSRYKRRELGNVIWYAGGQIDWNNIIGSHIGVDEVDTGQFKNKKEIDFATGACMYIKKEVFEKIGLFDEKYFLYLEDMDFCYRAKKAGFKIIFEPEAVLWHKNAQSAGGSGSKLQDYYITRNRLLFAFKFAKLNTKLAVLKQAVLQLKNKTKRQALFDFLTLKFYKRDI